MLYMMFTFFILLLLTIYVFLCNIQIDLYLSIHSADLRLMADLRIDLNNIYLFAVVFLLARQKFQA